MLHNRLRWLCATALLVGACGSDPDPNPPMDGASSTDAPAPRDISTSTDAADRAPSSDATVMDASTSSDGSTARDATAEDASTSMDRSDSAPAADARTDVAEATVDNGDGGVPPGPMDADGSGPSNSDVATDAAADADATAMPDAAGGDVDPSDAAADIPQADVPTASDATSDAIDAAGDGADAAASGFPGSELVDATQGAMINGWVGTPTQLWTLCYSTRLHQRSGAAFHTNCAYKGASVSIARVSYMTETRVIGGYNSGSWTTPAMQTYSPFSGSFLFSVTNAFKHDFPGTNSGPFWVFQNQYYGPTFGGGNDWYVHSQMTMGTCRPGFTYQCRVGTMDSTTCNIDFCGTPSQSEWYTLEVLEVWVK